MSEKASRDSTIEKKAKPSANTNPKPGDPKAGATGANKAGAKRPATAPKTSPAAAKANTSAKSAAKAANEKAAAKQEPAEEEAPAQTGGIGGFLKSRFFLWGSTAWGSSMLLHMAVLIMLGLITYTVGMKEEIKEIVAAISERPEDMLNQVLEQEVKPSKTLDLVSSSPSSIMGAMGSVSALAEPQTAAEVSDAPSEVKVDVGETNVFASTGTKLSQELPEGTLGEPQAIVGDYADAMDRITQEILARLAKGKVLVMWAFDESESMLDDRQEIMGRIGRVYEELGLATSAKGDALLTAVTSYGGTSSTHTPKPTSNVDEIMKAMNEVKTDPSGLEHQCQAVTYTIQQYANFAKQGQRQLMLIMVTDESGEFESNAQYLEATIAVAKQSRCPIYCLGREAVFGYPYARMRWEDPKTGVPFWLVINRGPETPEPEQLQIDGLHRRWDAHPSGFGPYEQTRMAKQTGGVFFMLPSPEANLVGRDNRKYALEAMRPYLPDLSARSDYISERDKYEMRRIVWKVISDLNPFNGPNKGQVEVRVDHFSLEKAEFAKQATAEQAKAQVLIGYLKAAEQALDKVEKLRAREVSPRWRANFDMMYAQVVAYQVRLWEYGYYLEEFKKNPKPVKNVFGAKRPTTNWDLHRSRTILLGDKFKKEMDTALARYQKIISEHAGTPYAARAEYEIKTGFGVDMHEDWDDLNLRRGITPPKL